MVYSERNYKEHQTLENTVRMPKSEKPRFDWGNLVEEAESIASGVSVTPNFGTTPKKFTSKDVADIVGGALTDLLVAREEKEAEQIFSETNQKLVLAVASEVAGAVSQLVETKGEALTEREMNLAIERALVKEGAHDVARSFVVARAQQRSNIEAADAQAAENASHGGSSEIANKNVNASGGYAKLGNVRLIRRGGQVVPWDGRKIEIAVRKAFLSLKLDSEAAVEVAEAVTEALANDGRAFIDIEDVQDLVQGTLMQQGHFKVAEAYILYRAHRARMRSEEGEAHIAAESAEAPEQQEAMIMVKKDNGETFFWDGRSLQKRIEFAMIGLELDMPFEAIEQELRRSIYPEMTEKELQQTVILNAKALIERDADFAKFAGRILLSYIYQEVLGWDIVEGGMEQLKELHRTQFLVHLKRGVELKRIDPKMLELYNVSELAAELDPSADLDFDYLGIQTLYDRYLIIDKSEKNARRLEVPQFFWMRVAMGLFVEDGDTPELRGQRAAQLYKLYKSRRYCSSTPTLFNAGTCHSQLSSCYLYKVDDSIESIMQRGIAENAYLSKWAGGLGGSWTAVRGTGGYIGGTNGESQGVIPFLKLHNDQLVAVNQGGKRRGSGCAYLETWHNDIDDFMELRRNTGDDRRRTHDMNTANWIPDLFMKRMENRESWTLFRTNEVPELHDLYGKAFEAKYTEYEQKAQRGEIFGKVVNAIDLWKKMLAMVFETGHPWITFKDPCNVRSPQDHAGVIHSSNLCTEITLNTSADETAVCNLGSVVLDNHLKADGSLDHEKLSETIRIAVRALDNVIDINFYPTEAASNSNRRHRPVGMGVMGLANALHQRGHSFASEEAVDFNDEFMEAIAYYAYEASSDLAAERGTYSSYEGSKWSRGLLPQDTVDMLEAERGMPVNVPRGGKMDWTPVREKIAKHGMRNSNVLAIAPTATISNITGTSPCIEPAYKNLFVRSNLSGDFVMLSQNLVRDLKKIGLWNADMIDQLKYFDGELGPIEGIPQEIKDRYKTVFDIDYQYFIDAAARRQKWIDQAQSVNLFLGEPDIKTLSHMYRAAWHAGLKTTYYLRTLGASSIEKATLSVKKETRGIVAGKGADGKDLPAETKTEYSAEQKAACSIDAMLNGGECEACQ